MLSAPLVCVVGCGSEVHIMTRSRLAISWLADILSEGYTVAWQGLVEHSLLVVLQTVSKIPLYSLIPMSFQNSIVQFDTDVIPTFHCTVWYWCHSKIPLYNLILMSFQNSIVQFDTDVIPEFQGTIWYWCHSRIPGYNLILMSFQNSRVQFDTDVIPEFHCTIWYWCHSKIPLYSLILMSFQNSIVQFDTDVIPEFQGTIWYWYHFALFSFFRHNSCICWSRREQRSTYRPQKIQDNSGAKSKKSSSCQSLLAAPKTGSRSWATAKRQDKDVGKELSEKAEDRRAESAHENAPEAAPKALSVSLIVFNVNFVVFFFLLEGRGDRFVLLCVWVCFTHHR